jgi:hypothetical protein
LACERERERERRARKNGRRESGGRRGKEVDEEVY